LRRTGQRAHVPKKLLDAVDVGTKKNKVKVDLSRLYKGIDLPETLSNLTGKRIRRILPAPPSASQQAGPARSSSKTARSST